MELREFAETILFTPDVSVKLTPPVGELTDNVPGESRTAVCPARPPELDVAGGKRGPKMPHESTLDDDRRRGLAHHVMANHELQALEAMAWVLVRFPEAPPAFRRGLLHILCEEQRHTRWHMDRATALGRPFGSVGASGYVWRRTTSARSLLEYCACLPLTFEAANLDHSRQFEQVFATVGDAASAGVMRAIHDDEIRHVRFGLAWLRRLKEPADSDWQAFVLAQPAPLEPSNARGRDFDRAARRRVGMDDDTIDRVYAAPTVWVKKRRERTEGPPE